MMNPRLYKVGSDPELLFTNSEGVLPSLKFLKCGKKSGLKSFLGCDAHPATAEIRPRASRNVDQHLMDIAFGIKVLSEHRRTFPYSIGLQASPYLYDEALGGHIHLSMFFNDPLAKEVMDKYNMVYHVGSLRSYNQNTGMVYPIELPEELAPKLREYVNRARAGTIITPEVVCKVLNHLIMPFELWIQKWKARQQRENWCLHSPHYNNDANYLIRWLTGTAPNLPIFNKYAYLHVEYRTPSTWLQHPAVAYVYLALAKLTILNFDKIAKRAFEAPPILLPSGGSSEYNQIAKEVLFSRLSDLGELKKSGDLWFLNQALKICEEQGQFIMGTHLVDTRAWEKLLA